MANDKLQMIVWDVERGNAISLHLPNGKTVMVDCGNSGSFSPVEWLHKKGVNNIHTLIVTHPHADHMADIAVVRKLGMGPSVLFRPKGIPVADIENGNADKQVVRDYLTIDATYTTPVTSTDDICDPACAGAVGFKVFKPIAHPTSSNLNNRSMVVVVTYGKTTILLPGDCTPAAMKELLEDPSFVNAVAKTNIMVAPHHGHESCYCQELMEIVKPWLCIVSDGKDTQETSAVSQYDKHCSGIAFVDDDKERTYRKCLTTRADGHIIVDIPCVGGVGIHATRKGLESC